MGKNRVEAFSDGVFAIIITIMVLELKIPKGSDFASLIPVLPAFISYVLSFVYLGIYWNNHHHMLQATERVNGAVLWANLHLLFWLSLFPVVTGWVGDNHFALAPMALYGVVLLLAGVAYLVLQNAIIACHGNDSLLARAVGGDAKGKLSAVLYGLAIPIAYFEVWISGSIYVLVAMIWLIPDRRIERVLVQAEK